MEKEEEGDGRPNYRSTFGYDDYASLIVAIMMIIEHKNWKPNYAPIVVDDIVLKAKLKRFTQGKEDMQLPRKWGWGESWWECFAY